MSTSRPPRPLLIPLKLVHFPTNNQMLKNYIIYSKYLLSYSLVICTMKNMNISNTSRLIHVHRVLLLFYDQSKSSEEFFIE